MNSAQMMLGLPAPDNPSGLHVATLAEGEFARSVRRFDDFGAISAERCHDGVPVFENEFWTSRQRQAARLHEISYRACYKPQLPRFFIERLSRPGECVYDPFMGRGTTLIEAALLGRRVAGTDINPLSEMLVRPRLAPPAMEAIKARLDGMALEYDGPLDDDLLVFYSPGTLRQIMALRAALNPGDPVDGWIRMVAINRLTGHSPGFFSVYTLPPNQAASVASQRKINVKRGQRPPDRDIKAIIIKKSRALLGSFAPHDLGPAGAAIGTAAADHATHIKDSSVDLVVTSPPFVDIVNYRADNWMRCWFAGIDPDQVRIAHHRSVEDWGGFVRRCFDDFARVVRPGGHVAFEVGEVRKGTVRLDEIVLERVSRQHWQPLCVLINRQDFTKTANCWGVDNNKSGVNTNRIVVFERR